MSLRPNIALKRGIHRDQNIVRIEFSYDQKVINLLREETTARWSQTIGCWYMPESNFNLKRFFAAFKPLAYINYSALKNNTNTPENAKQPHPKKINRKKHIVLPKDYLEKLQQERYSENTIKIYTHYFKDFVAEFSEKNYRK